jgi:hypothetical protein
MELKRIIHTLMEFSSETDQLKSKIYSMSDIFSEHVCKIVFYTSVDTSWYISVYKSLVPTMKKIKSKSKRLSAETITSLLYDPNFEDMEDFESYLNTEFEAITYNEGFKYLNRRDISSEEAFSRIKTFWSHVLPLCKAGKLTREQCTHFCQEDLER